MLRSYKYRLYPTKKQSVLINKHIGACRFVYNLALETKQTAYIGNKINLSCFDLHKQLPDLKKECEWLKDISAQSLQQSITDLDCAFTNFFKHQSEYPKYKSKHDNKQSYRLPQRILIKNDRVFVPMFREGIKLIQHREFKGDIKNDTISRTPTGKYFISLLINTNQSEPITPKINEINTIGVDLGIKDFLITSNGLKIGNPKYLKNSLGKLKYVQSRVGKHNGKKNKNKLSLLHEKVTNQRKDFLHKTSSKLISENQTICLEDLNIKGMIKNHKLAQSIQDVSWGIFVDMLEYKANWYGKNLIKIGRFEPSSKCCSNCGSINHKLTLSDREWTCDNCNVTHDRDVNAAKNIKSFGLKNILSGTDRKNHKELPTLVGTLTYGTHI